MDKKVYCTLFDTFYLAHGLLMIESLLSHAHVNDRIYVFCFDDQTFEILTQLQIPQVIPISLAEFETTELKAVKATRSKGEYCWTSTPHVLLHVLKKRGERECTYVDADLFFYSNPSVAIPDSPDELVLITEHRYTPEYDLSSTSGRFCVQFVTFKNDPRSLPLLEHWGAQCLNWCYARYENGKFGDQMYLDEWPNFAPWVKISDDPRVGVAPWNIQGYIRSSPEPLFYHFHALRWYSDDRFDLGGFDIQPWAQDKIYIPYIQKFAQKSFELRDRFNIPLPQINAPKTLGLKRIRYWLKGILRPNKLIHLSHIS